MSHIIYRFERKSELALEVSHQLKRLTIITLIYDDYLMETLVLKGGNAMLMAYDLST